MFKAALSITFGRQGPLTSKSWFGREHFCPPTKPKTPLSGLNDQTIYWPRPKCSRGAVYTAHTLFRLCSVYYRYTATRRKSICSVIVYCLCRAYLTAARVWIYKSLSPGSVLTGYPSHGSVRYTACTVLLAVDLQYILHPTASILHFGLGRAAYI